MMYKTFSFPQNWLMKITLHLELLYSSRKKVIIIHSQTSMHIIHQSVLYIDALYTL
jgi:hypothetical protein